MTDTTQDIKNLQLKIWLNKSPMERLRQLMTDNEALIKFWNEVKPSDKILEVISTEKTNDSSKNRNSSTIKIK
ncbi:hypothetical protein ABF176_002223 [Flavobacterium psychrophilum]